VLDGYQMVGVGELVSISVAKSRSREGWGRALVGSMPKADRTWQQGVDLRGVVYRMGRVVMSSVPEADVAALLCI
jgi:hypothetical protein